MRTINPWYEVRVMGTDARERFGRWIDSGPSLEGLLLALEYRQWRDDPANEARRSRPPIAWSLDRDEVDRIKAEAARRIEEAGGRVNLGYTAVTVVDGELRVEMIMGPRARGMRRIRGYTERTDR